MTGNLNHIIDQVVKDKGVNRDVLIEALESAVLSAANRKYRNTRDLEAHYNPEIGEVEVFEFVTVVEEVEDSYKQINLEEAREADPDLILLDLCLPHMSGWEVMKGLQTLAAQAEIPVVIMSALSSTDFGPAAWAMGCTMYLQKPFDADDLLLVVNRVLRPRGRCATA